MDNAAKRAGEILARMRPEVLEEMRRLYRQGGRRPGFLEEFQQQAAQFGLAPELAEAALQLLDSLAHRDPVTGGPT